MNKTTELEPLIWHNERRRIDELIPYDKNPRRLTKQQRSDLKDSISRFHLVEVPAINTDNTIVSGHMRLKVLSGIEGRDYEVDVRVPSRTLTEQEFKEYNIRANKNTGEFDFDILSSAFEYEDLQDWGFSDDELTDFTVDLIDDDSDADDVAPDKPEKARSQLGDIYELGNHRVMCGDSTDKEIVAALMNGDKADMVFTDPPYGVNYSHADRPKPSKTNLGKIMNDNIDLTKFLPKIFSNLYLAAADNCSFYIWHAGKTAHIFYGCIEGSDLEFNQMLIWKKPMLLGRAKYQYAHEPCIFAIKGTPYFTEDRTKTTVWDFGGYDKSSNVHPTQKPVFLPEEAIKNSCKKDSAHKRGGIVLDLFLGSGSTLIACEKTKRRCYGMELDPQYVDVIVQRYVDYTGNNNIRLNGEDIEWGDNE